MEPYQFHREANVLRCDCHESSIKHQLWGRKADIRASGRAGVSEAALPCALQACSRKLALAACGFWLLACDSTGLVAGLRLVVRTLTLRYFNMLMEARSIAHTTHSGDLGESDTYVTCTYHAIKAKSGHTCYP
eukprot:scaffold40242_cov35-Tisochrysis_lutea.AAC.2